MPEAVSALVTQIIEEAAFDAVPATVLRWLNRRHKVMVSRAHTFRKTVSAGPTVANQAEYTQPAGLVSATEIGVAGLTYGKARRTDKALGAQSRLHLSGPGGIFYETADSAGVKQFGLYPVPTEAGLAVEVYGAFSPPDLLIDNTVPLWVDDEAIEGLMAGVFATGLSRPETARLDLSQGYEAQFGGATDELRVREARRLRGSGPARIRVEGINA